MLLQAAFDGYLLSIAGQMNGYVGTEGYMAPEQLFAYWNSHHAAGKHPATPSTSSLTYDGYTAEIWSAGVVAFDLLTGHKPFP